MHRLCANDPRSNILPLLFGVWEWVVSLLIILFVKVQERRVRNGITSATSRLILPVYMWTLLWMVFAGVFEGGVYTMCSPSFVVDAPSSSAVCDIFKSVSFGVNHLALEGVPLLMLQYGAGVRALVRAFTFTSIWCVFFSTALAAASLSSNKNYRYYSNLWKDAILFLFYSLLAFLPPRFLFRRPAVYHYSLFWACVRLLFLVADIMMIVKFHDTKCTLLYCGAITYSACKPLIVYHCLQQDSMFWLGIRSTHKATLRPYMWVESVWGWIVQVVAGSYFRRHSLISPSSSSLCSTPRVSLIARNIFADSNFSSPSYAATLNLSSAREIALHSDELTIINFALLNLRDWHVLGAGGTSKVFVGTLRGQRIAVKILYTYELTPEIVQRFLREAQLLQVLKHPNIPDFHGICLAPPAICLCMELCGRGSLHECMQSKWFGELSWSGKVGIALQCSRAVAYLHSFKPPIVHNDIKSLNFFVTDNGCVKLGDLDLGFHVGEKHIHPTCPHWCAPETIANGSVSTASDCYGLAIVLWEIVSMKPPFYEQCYTFRHCVTEAICHGVRPSIDDANGFADVSEAYISLIREGWDQNPLNRPTASEMEIRLTKLMAQCNGYARVYNSLNSDDSLLEEP